MDNKIQLIILLILTLIQDYSSIGNYLTYKKNPEKYTPKQIKSARVVAIALVILTIAEIVFLCLNLFEGK